MVHLTGQEEHFERGVLWFLHDEYRICKSILHGYFPEVQPRYINHMLRALLWFFPLILWILWENILERIFANE